MMEYLREHWVGVVVALVVFEVAVYAFRKALLWQDDTAEERQAFRDSLMQIYPLPAMERRRKQANLFK
jgi:hypothetical protein